ncbi:outer membrane protein assembly factor BamB family protein [Catenulispora rubra]|uniref:outer membrane protein assembly factor BamB family protein n=1 Tax=Catenulispora rubra TaxID=280293 RepID=UPI00189205C3|nr:PQQ-binding-like beta-propeller repeat protein [Catenulispora rubra]
MSDFPLPIAWRHRTAADFTPLVPPLFEAGTLTVRAGAALIRLDAADGNPMWTAELPGNDTGGKLLIGGGLLFTNAVRRPERLDTVIGVSESGQVEARVDLPAIIAPESAYRHDGELWLAATEPEHGAVVYVLDAHTGDMRRRIPLPWGADGFAAWSGGLLVRNQVASQGRPGLYVLDGRPLIAEQVWKSTAVGGRIMASAGNGGPGSLGQVLVLAADDLRELWTAPSVVEAAALDADHVYAADGDALVAFRAADGAEVWRTAPTGRRPSTVGAHGPVVSYGFLGGRLLFRAADGAPIGRLPSLLTAPVYGDGRLYVAGVGEVLALDIAD